MISVIIPAYNEAAVIGRCLTTLLEGAGPDEVEVIVACNGCHDDTAEIARGFGPPVRVVETKKASKVAALNLAEEEAVGFPRFYVDADVALRMEAVREIAAMLEDGTGTLAAAPRAVTRFDESTWPVRAFYRVWTSTPYFREGMIGCGVSAISREGRQRFDRFPDVIADDGYLRALFTAGERTTVESCRVEVWAPKTLRDLIKTKTRSRLGFYQLRRDHGELLARESQEKDYSGALRGFIAKPHRWLDVAVYVAVNLWTRRRARGQIAQLASYRWERDESSRIAVR